MPKKIVLTDFSGGLAERHWDTPQINRLAKEGQYVGGDMNPLPFPGFLSPAFDSDSTTTLSQTNQLSSTGTLMPMVSILDGNLSSESQSVYVGNDDKIQGIDVDPLATPKILASGDGTGEFPHTINPGSGTHSAHAGFSVKDMIDYQVNGNQRLIYFYTDDNDGDAGSYDLASSFTQDATNEDLFSNATGGITLNKNFDIIAQVSDNGFAYVANGNALHKFDGTSDGGSAGTVTTNVITLPASRNFFDLQDGLGKLWMLVQDTNAGVLGAPSNPEILIWNRISTAISIDDALPIRDSYHVHALFFLQGRPHIISTNSDRVLQLKRFNGSDFATISDLADGDAYPQNRHCVWPYFQGVVWLAADGKLYYYGKPSLSSQAGVHVLGNLGADTGGGIAPHLTRNLFLAYEKSDTNTIVTVNPFSTTNTASSSIFYTRNIELPKLSTVTRVTVYYIPYTGSNGDVNLQMNVFKNFSTSSEWTTAKGFDYDDNESRGFITSSANITNANSIIVQLQWASGEQITQGPVVYRIEVEYEPTTKSI